MKVTCSSTVNSLNLEMVQLSVTEIKDGKGSSLAGITYAKQYTCTEIISVHEAEVQTTVYVQIFEGRNFRGSGNFRIFAILFSMIV